MVNALSLTLIIANLVVGVYYFIIFAIFIYRFFKVRLWVTYLRGLTPLLIFVVCFTTAFGLFSTNENDALFWYRLSVVSIITAVTINFFFLVLVIYGTLHGTSIALILFLVGIIFANYSSLVDFP